MKKRWRKVALRVDGKMLTTHKIWRITQVKRLVNGKYDHEIYFHRDKTRMYLNPKRLHMLYVAIGRHVNNIEMDSIGGGVITRYNVGSKRCGS